MSARTADGAVGISELGEEQQRPRLACSTSSRDWPFQFTSGHVDCQRIGDSCCCACPAAADIRPTQEKKDGGCRRRIEVKKRRINIKRHANAWKGGPPHRTRWPAFHKVGGSATLNDETAFPTGLDFEVADGRSFVVQSLAVAAFELRPTYFASCIQLDQEVHTTKSDGQRPMAIDFHTAHWQRGKKYQINGRNQPVGLEHTINDVIPPGSDFHLVDNGAR
jgi:hypothetical protein